MGAVECVRRVDRRFGGYLGDEVSGGCCLALLEVVDIIKGWKL